MVEKGKRGQICGDRRRFDFGVGNTQCNIDKVGQLSSHTFSPCKCAMESSRI